jgi:hypothetical protein
MRPRRNAPSRGLDHFQFDPIGLMPPGRAPTRPRADLPSAVPSHARVPSAAVLSCCFLHAEPGSGETLRNQDRESPWPRVTRDLDCAMFRSRRNPCIETTDNPIDAGSRECSARAPRGRALGRCPDGRGTEARRGAAEPATPASRAARRAVARARHAAGTTRDPFASIDAHLFKPPRVARGVPQVRFSRRPLLGPERSRPPRRRGRWAPRVR